jgi:beta-mannosidase
MMGTTTAPFSSNLRSLSKDWHFTQIGGGAGTKDGEWLPVSEFPTSIHVELLKLGKIPDPVRSDKRTSD